MTSLVSLHLEIIYWKNLPGIFLEPMTEYYYWDLSLVGSLVPQKAPMKVMAKEVGLVSTISQAMGQSLVAMRA